MRKQLILALAVMGFVAAPAQAQQHEIMTDVTNSSFTFQDGTNLGVNAGYGYIINDMFEATARIGLNYVKPENVDGEFGYSAMVGPRVNFGGAIADAAWVGGEVGVVKGASAAAESDFAWGFNAGKRFNFAGNVSYAPYVSYGKVGDADGQFAVAPLAFNFTW